MVNWDKPIQRKDKQYPVRFLGRRKHPTHPIMVIEQLTDDVEIVSFHQENGLWEKDWDNDAGQNIENVPEPRLVSCTNYYPASPTSKKHVHKYDFEDAMRGRDIDVPGYNITVTELDGVYTIKLTAWNMAIAQGEEL